MQAPGRKMDGLREPPRCQRRIVQVGLNIGSHLLASRDGNRGLLGSRASHRCIRAGDEIEQRLTEARR